MVLFKILCNIPDEDDKKSMLELSKNELINALVNGVFMSNGKNSAGVNETHYMQWPEIVWIEPNFKKFGDSTYYVIEVKKFSRTMFIMAIPRYFELQKISGY